MREVTRQAAPRRRRLVIVLVPAVLALLGGSGFTTYVLTREPTHLETIGCFETADLDGNTAVVSADGRDPVAICSELWRQGAVGDAPPPPRLAACVLETGAIGVFPSAGGGTCARLGIADLPASYAIEGERLADLRDAIVGQLGEPASGSSPGSPRCVGEQAAREAVRRTLDAFGYADWRVEVAAGVRFSAERPCAEAAFDGERKVVTLVPVWE